MNVSEIIKEENRLYDIDNPIDSFLYYVARPYSHTDRRCLWKIESRAQLTRRGAQDWCDFKNECEVNSKDQPCPHRGEYFVLAVPKTVKMENDNDN